MPANWMKALSRYASSFATVGPAVTLNAVAPRAVDRRSRRRVRAGAELRRQADEGAYRPEGRLRARVEFDAGRRVVAEEFASRDRNISRRSGQRADKARESRDAPDRHTRRRVHAIVHRGWLDAHLHLREAAHPEAGVRPRNIEEARAIGVADTNIFDRRGFAHRQVGRLRKGSGRHEGGGTSQKDRLQHHQLLLISKRCARIGRRTRTSDDSLGLPGARETARRAFATGRGKTATRAA